MKRARLITSAVLLALACVTLLETGKLPIGNLHSPQAGFFPLLIGLLLGVFSVVLLFQTLKEKRGETSPAPTPSGRQKRVLLTLGALFCVALFFERLGYLISTFLLIGFLLATVSRQKPWVVITTAFLSSVISYLLFGVVLQTQLPAGILSSFFGS